MRKSVISDNFYTNFNYLQEIATKYNINNDIKLPQLVTVGEQSSGKSSLLNAIAGVNFLPQGKGIVTRCPIVIQLTTSKKEMYIVSGVICDSIAGVEKELRHQMANINSNDISTHHLNVAISAPNVPTLSLVDLPGLVRNALASQKKGIVEEIEKMVQSYIENEKTVILAIVPANNDIVNSIALEWARRFDKKGKRTLGVEK